MFVADDNVAHYSLAVGQDAYLPFDFIGDAGEKMGKFRAYDPIWRQTAPGDSLQRVNLAAFQSSEIAVNHNLSTLSGLNLDVRFAVILYFGYSVLRAERKIIASRRFFNC